MLRVTTLHASSAAATASYYTQYLTQAPGEVPGVWLGKQAGGLGLAGEATSEQLQSLLEGRDPTTGAELGHRLADRTTGDGRVIRAVSGFDATFSAPKSVSLLWALTQDARVLEVHDVAVTAALDYVERRGSTTRVRSNGRRLHPDSQGLTIAGFRQTTSRADDPQLHTHAVISAKVQTGDGRWLALDARFLKRHQRTIGGLYQSVLRNELSNRLGVHWLPIVNGQAEIAGFPEELVTVFSKRTAEVDRALQAKVEEFRRRQGRQPTRWERAALTREAAVDTRGRKTGHGAADLRAEWLAEAHAHGWSPQAVVDHIATTARQPAKQRGPATVGDVIEALTMTGSTWSRADVVRAICDHEPPMPQVSGKQWAAALERACDKVLEHCVELDPHDPAAPRRRSDGRSMWLDPSAPHITSNRVLAEEEHVLSWAMGAQADDPTPSPHVAVDGLDVLQAEVAAAVAGHDRLVLAVGPAGTGKTTTLRAAANDLARQQRPAFGVSPTAKAARVLERETGIASDTVAKLLHEWQHHNRPPHERYRLSAGTTLIVDEAGMLGTNALHRLVRLAETQRWRLVLVGDHRQLQAVGRGGLFHELCVTGRCHELQRIHRFVEPWEAAASLQLRNGDPRAFDVYQAHDRIVPGTLDDHVARIAQMWMQIAAAGGTIAITTSSNEHVDAINAAVQAARIDADQLGESSVAIAGGERAHVGDVVATRRNDRRLTTTNGEPVRNRELWTVTAPHHDGSLTVTPQAGQGQVTLPADYTTQHVRLGYAATEHGNQADTVTIGIELATAATTSRGLYVGMTRGRDTNMLFVVTEQPDLTEARDLLDRIVAVDRADIPATAVRRQLAETDHTPRPCRPAPSLQPRYQTPEWFEGVRATAVELLAQAQAAADAEEAQRHTLEHNRDAAAARYADAKRQYEPRERAIADAQRAVDIARRRQYEAGRDLANAGIRHRRSARRFVQAANDQHQSAQAHLDSVRAQAQPAAQQLQRAHQDVQRADATMTARDLLAKWSGRQHTLTEALGVVEALDIWKQWADGHAVPTAQLRNAVRHLNTPQRLELGQQTHALATVLTAWAEAARVDLTPPESMATVPRSEGPSLGFGI